MLTFRPSEHMGCDRTIGAWNTYYYWASSDNLQFKPLRLGCISNKMPLPLCPCLLHKPWGSSQIFFSRFSRTLSNDWNDLKYKMTGMTWNTISGMNIEQGVLTSIQLVGICWSSQTRLSQTAILIKWMLSWRQWEEYTCFNWLENTPCSE